MRLRLVVAAVCLLLPAVPVVADPLAAPPQDRLRVWLVEWGGGRARVQSGRVTFRWTQERNFLTFIGFQPKGRSRELFDGAYSAALWPPPGHYYPSASVAGNGPVLGPCPAVALCSNAGVYADDEYPLFAPPQPITLSFYVVAFNVEVTGITESPGWRKPRELTGGFAVRLLRDTGTSVRLNNTVLEHFTGVGALGGRHGSVAWASVPCLPGTPDRAELRGGDPNPLYPNRHMSCVGSLTARGAARGPTRWDVVGETLGEANIIDRLIVVDLPRFP